MEQDLAVEEPRRLADFVPPPKNRLYCLGLTQASCKMDFWHKLCGDICDSLLVLWSDAEPDGVTTTTPMPPVLLDTVLIQEAEKELRDTHQGNFQTKQALSEWPGRFCFLGDGRQWLRGNRLVQQDEQTSLLSPYRLAIRCSQDWTKVEVCFTIGETEVGICVEPRESDGEQEVKSYWEGDPDLDGYKPFAVFLHSGPMEYEIRGSYRALDEYISILKDGALYATSKFHMTEPVRYVLPAGTPLMVV